MVFAPIVPMAATVASTLPEGESWSYEVKWDKSNMPLSVVNNDVQTPKGNTVTVKVTYQWFPELILVGPFTLTSSSTAQMMY